MEKSGQMFASPPNHTSRGLPTSQWGPHPTVPGEVGVVTSSQSEIKDLIGLFFMVTLNLIALLANAGVMVAIARAPHLKRFAFVCHLCAVDMLCAILLMPLGILTSSPYFGTVVFTVLECQVYIFLNVFLTCASILTVTAISVERYFYIVHPMRYEMKMSINLAMGVMLLIWVKSILLALVPLYGWPAYGPQSSIAASHCSLHWSHGRLRRLFAVLFSVVCFLFPALVIFTVYGSVYKVARSAALQQAPGSAWATSTSSSSSGNPTKRRSDSINSQTTIITAGRNLPQRLSPERAFSGGKAALTLVVIVGQFLLCWLPYFIFHLHLSFGASRQSPGDVEEAVTWLAYSSFAVNPFFYGMLNRQIREELVKFRRCCGSSRPVELGASGQEGSLQENFLQFLQKTGCSTSSPRNSLEQGARVPVQEARVPGQIPEEPG
ncbi:probable G-protein coupled receptor [Hypomesus transpacificus]|uniref:probable G-protein coupled receptor n=1 Tax=Hypomesus transpacificus TaxID=137520 RepID=UPI001F080E35|nr:probable G-protein coupled receptor [Hypomesus transpacificus]